MAGMVIPRRMGHGPPIRPRRADRHDLQGTNGRVRRWTLVGRKLAQDGGKHVMAFFALVKDEVAGSD